MACNTTGYTGQNYCEKTSRFGRPTGIAFAVDGQSFSEADFLLEDSFINAVKSQQIFPVMSMKGFEDQSTDPTYHEYDNEDRDLVDQGKYRFAASFSKNECAKKQLLNFRGFSQGFYLIYGNVIRGRTVDGGSTIEPIRITQTNVEKASLPTMTEKEMINVVIDLVSEKDLNEYDYSREMEWDVTDLDGLTEVTLSVVSASATSIVVDVATDCGGNTKPISGLGTEATDWEVETGTISTVEESSSILGRYTISGTGMDGTIDLADPSGRSDDVLVISAGAITLDID